jgi:hypothetical protein
MNPFAVDNSYADTLRWPYGQTYQAMPLRTLHARLDSPQNREAGPVPEVQERSVEPETRPPEVMDTLRAAKQKGSPK